MNTKIHSCLDNIKSLARDIEREAHDMQNMNIKEVLQKENERIKKEYGSMENYRKEMSLRQIGCSTGEEEEEVRNNRAIDHNNDGKI